MKPSTRSLLKTVSRRDSGWAPPALAEQAARKAADATAAPAMVSAQSRADFSGVKVHTRGPLAEAAEDLGARAFAHGRDIAFAPGEFRSGHLPTQQLLAHELTHVAQIVRDQLIAIESRDIGTLGDFVVRPAVDIIEQRPRQPSFRRSLEILGI